MTDAQATHPAPKWTKPTRRVLAVGACVIAATYVGVLARRPIISVDLGYHLAYGRVFLDRGIVVGDDSFIQPPITKADAPDGELPPGAHFDETGRYRFVNANWGTQVILAWLWNHGGWTAMNLTLAALIGLIAAGQAAVLHRLQVPLAWLAPVWLAFAVVGEERFQLRPELFAFACLTWQLWLLCGRITWPRVVAAGAIQLVAVNLHSYWLLGAFVVSAFAADAAVRAAWGRWIKRAAPVRGDLRRMGRLLVCAAAMVPAAMAHPAGPANAVFPFRTLRYLRTHQIPSRTHEEVSRQWRAGELHPWQTIGEFHHPFVGGGWQRRSTWGLAALLVLAAAGVVILSVRRCWALAGILAAMSLAALSMRRNMIIPAILAGPLIAAAAHSALTAWGVAGRPSRLGPIAAAACQIVLIALGGWWIFEVVTNRHYVAGRRALHFGGGASRLVLPLDTCRWLDAQLPRAEPAFVDQNPSSSVVFYATKISGAPVLTNTWATPPGRNSEVFDLGGGRLPISTLYDWHLDLAVIQGWKINQTLIRRLLASDDWALVHLETWFITFARRTDAHAALIDAHEITFDSFDTTAFIEACRRADPIAALALKAGAGALQVMGWYDQAPEVWRACLDDPDGRGFPEAWLSLGEILGESGRTRLRYADRSGYDDLLEAKRSFERALEIKPDYEKARTNLRTVNNDLYRFRHAR